MHIRRVHSSSLVSWGLRFSEAVNISLLRCHKWNEEDIRIHNTKKIGGGMHKRFLKFNHSQHSHPLKFYVLFRGNLCARFSTLGISMLYASLVGSIFLYLIKKIVAHLHILLAKPDIFLLPIGCMSINLMHLPKE